MARWNERARSGAGGDGALRIAGPCAFGRVDPGGSLWDLVWANVSDGVPQDAKALPWLHPTGTSAKGSLPTYPPETNRTPAEAFFGMPRRLRLVVEDDLLTEVVQKPWGTEYEGWPHPLTPCFEKKAGAG